MEQLWKRLVEQCRAHPSLLLAFSGGVDSTLVAHAARESGSEALRLVFCRTPLITEEEQEQARALAEWLGLSFHILELDVLALPEVAQNRVERCYACKRALFSQLQQLAAAWGLDAVADGTNSDDQRAANRPGSRACAELGIAQPLAEAGLTKAEVRQLARYVGLPNHDQPARPCLATRFPYDTELTPPLLERVAEGERILRGAGLTEFRLRSHGELCRIEAGAPDQQRLLGQAKAIEAALIDLGWRFVTLDLGGLTSGRFDK